MPTPRPTPAAIIPASGRSERLGGDPKLLLAIGDTTVIGWTCRALLGGGIARIVVTAREDDRELQDWCRRCEIEVVLNSESNLGMLHSIRLGIRHLGGAEALTARRNDLLITPGDLPAMQSASVRHLLLAADHHPKALVLPTHDGRRGHPLRVPPGLIAEISRLDPGIGLRQLLDRHIDRIHEIPVRDAGVVDDLDTPADYARLRDLIERRQD